MVLANNERIVIPETMRFIWELESLDNLSPSLLTTVGVLCMSGADVGWKLMLVQWLENRSQVDQDLLSSLCNSYIQKVLNFVGECTQPPMFEQKKGSNAPPRFQRVIQHTAENMIHTFCNLMEALVNPYPDLSDVEYERYFNFACVWAFGGTLCVEYREAFSCWWREQFDTYIDYPQEGMVYDYLVDSETHEFCRWSDMVPSYTSTPHDGIPVDAFVHTVHIEQLLHILGLLSDAGKPVMLVGENGCGKTSIINERIRTVCSGEVAEVLSLTVYANRFTNAQLLYDRLDERLEWKHGRTCVPKGNKRLLCLVDDLNLSQVDKYGFQTATELVREHLDDGGFYSPTTHSWRYVKNVTYVTTINPQTTANVPKLSQRLLRHFGIFACPYPGSNELQSIYTTLLHTHFLLPDSASSHHLVHDKAHHSHKIEESTKSFINLVVRVTLELHERLRTMFLPTAARCHYIFTTRDLSTVFRNVCLSLQPDCSNKSILLLWQHECHWIYGHRMVNEVDFRRFRQAFNTAVRKQFSNEEHIQLMTSPDLSVFSNLVEQDSGIVTAGIMDSKYSTRISDRDIRTDLYQPAATLCEVHELTERGVEEYNKIHPRIKLALYKVVIEQVCRLARIIASPHEGANTVLVSEGCPGRCTIIVKLAANLCGFSIYKINPTPVVDDAQYQIDQFKADLVHGYTRAGAKGEKILLLLHEEELIDEDFLVFLIEFIVSGSITHLFAYEEQTTIINSIRTEVTQAGLTYTRDVAWNFFLRTVRNNFRICLITGRGGQRFQRRCREYPAFAKNMNLLWFAHWNKLQLVEHALYHLTDVPWMPEIQRENIAHMLSSIHLVLRQHDGQERDAGEFGHITNTSYEKFVERFISLMCTRYTEVNDIQDAVSEALLQIRKENETAIKLKKQLEHELIVLSERKAGTIRILSQIGQDTAISEQQIKVVKNQMEKIRKLKKLLPEYQVAHERAVYKAIAIVADTKKVVQKMNIDKLAELRAMSKPVIDIEDLMAAIIMILKSPSADLTWQKGAKRQMANLERFIEELMSFDDVQLPEVTMMLVEPYLKKSSFDPSVLERKTGNSACASLCKWVRGVVKYHRMMLSKVKPLHTKVDETTQAVDSAQHKMNTLETKRKALEIRLADLARGFEEATIDKNEQDDKTIKMRKMLITAAQVRKILKGERERGEQIYDSFHRRLAALPGGCAMASAFGTYLGPYHHNFRRVMLTVHWPNCLRERGIPLVIDSIDGLKGRVIDWSISFLKTASGASSIHNSDFMSLEQYQRVNVGDAVKNIEEEIVGEKLEEDKEREVSKAEELGEGENPPGSTMQAFPKNNEKTSAEDLKQEDKIQTGEEDEGLTAVAEVTEEEDDANSEYTSTSGPVLTTMQYNRYLRSLIKLLVGEPTLNDWVRKDFGPRQMENAAMLCSSWQRPPMLIDPNGEGAQWLGRLHKLINEYKLISLDMESRWSDPQVILTLEKAITQGKPVLLHNCEDHIDNIIMPLIHHRNTSKEVSDDEDARMIMFCGRRILCHPNFRFFLSTPLAKPLFNPDIASTTCLINFGVSQDTLIEDLLVRAFARLRPELYQERMIALHNLQMMKDTLYHLSETVKERVLAGGQEAVISNAKALQFITDITDSKLKIAKKLTETQILIDDLETLKDELFPLARRAAMLFSVLVSLSGIHKEYQFPLPYFIELFDEAVGGELPKNFGQDPDGEDGYELDADSSVDVDKQRGMGSASTNEETEKTGGGETIVTAPSQSKEAVATKDVDDAHKVDEPGSVIDNADSTASTTAAQKFMDGSDSTHFPVLELPETAPLPTEGVEYTALSVTKIKQLMDILSSLVFHRIRQSLYEEDKLLFATLMCLNIQNEGGEVFSNEELSLLLQGNPGLGMQLSLADFDSNEQPPAWLAKEKWEDILALSVLPGALDSLCVDFAQNSESWKSWYKSKYPEREKIPCAQISQDAEAEQTPRSARAGSRGSERAAAAGSPELGLMSEFHQLLILRMLRPDRLPTALSSYVQKNLQLTLPEETKFNLGDILLDARNHLGILLLLPQNSADSSCVSRLKLIRDPVAMLKDIAAQNNIGVETIKVGDCFDLQLDNTIDCAEKADGWIIIEDLHLAPSIFYKELKKRLVRLYNNRANLSSDQQNKSTFCVWLTTEPCQCIPDFLIKNLHKLSWSHMMSSIVDTKGSEPTQKRSGLPLQNLLPEAYLQTAIVSTMRKISSDFWESLSAENQAVRTLAFGIAIIHGVLVARQLFGSIGLSQWYPFDTVEINAAVGMVLGKLVRGEEDSEPILDDLCFAVSKLLYGALILDASDQLYVDSLCNNILCQIYKRPSAEILLGTILLQTPPDEVATVDYADWFERTGNDRMSLPALQLGSGIERERCEANASAFISNLDHMFETQDAEAGDARNVVTGAISIPKLRSAIDVCLEELPPLLDLGQAPANLMQDFNFPYDCISAISLSTVSKTQMPESIGYVLLQECLWYNSIMCHIRQQIFDLQTSMLGGAAAIAPSYHSTVVSLQEEHVPVSWIHPNCQPCTHSLVSWLADLKMRYEQMQKWVLEKMVPTFRNHGILTTDPTIAQGTLSKVWLGGFVNPMALLTAYKQEAAILYKCSFDQVVYECHVGNSYHIENLDIDLEDGIFLTLLNIQGASWSKDKQTLKESKKSLNEIHSLFIRPVLKTVTESGEREGEVCTHGESNNVYNCPVYMNRSRQKLVTHFLLPCPPPMDQWIRYRAAIILDTGLTEQGVKKSRSYLMLQHQSPHQQDDGVEEEDDLESEFGGRLDGAPTPKTSRSNQSIKSSRSQLSYKAMTPNANPLPPELVLSREKAMMPDKADDSSESDSSSKKGSRKVQADSKAFVAETDSKILVSEKLNSKDSKQSLISDDDKRGAEPIEEVLERQDEDQRGFDKSASDGGLTSSSAKSLANDTTAKRPSQRQSVASVGKVSTSSRKGHVEEGKSRTSSGKSSLAGSERKGQGSNISQVVTSEEKRSLTKVPSGSDIKRQLSNPSQGVAENTDNDRIQESSNVSQEILPDDRKSALTEPEPRHKPSSMPQSSGEEIGNQLTKSQSISSRKSLLSNKSVDNGTSEQQEASNTTEEPSNLRHTSTVKRGSIVQLQPSNTTQEQHVQPQTSNVARTSVIQTPLSNIAQGPYVQPKPTNVTRGSFGHMQPFNTTPGSLGHPQSSNISRGSIIQSQSSNVSRGSIAQPQSFNVARGSVIQPQQSNMASGSNVQHQRSNTTQGLNIQPQSNNASRGSIVQPQPYNMAHRSSVQSQQSIQGQNISPNITQQSNVEIQSSSQGSNSQLQPSNAQAHDVVPPATSEDVTAETEGANNLETMDPDMSRGSELEDVDFGKTEAKPEL